MCAISMHTFCQRDISPSLSLHQHIGGGGPPWGSVVFLTVWLLGGEDHVLISRTNLLWGRQGFLMGLARSSGLAAAMSWFIQMTASKTERVVCLSPLLSSTPHQHSHKPEPQAPLALKQSCLTQSTHIPPLTVDGRPDDHDYLHRDKLSTSSSIHLTVCLTGCQPRVNGNA